MNNQWTTFPWKKKSRPWCRVRSVRPILDPINCARVTGRWGLLSHAHMHTPITPTYYNKCTWLLKSTTGHFVTDVWQYPSYKPTEPCVTVPLLQTHRAMCDSTPLINPMSHYISSSYCTWWWKHRTSIIHVAVPEILFICVFRVHHQVWCTIVLSLHWGWGSYVLHRCIRYSWVYTSCMSPTLSGTSANSVTNSVMRSKYTME